MIYIQFPIIAFLIQIQYWTVEAESYTGRGRLVDASYKDTNFQQFLILLIINKLILLKIRVRNG
jgi:hypothetical protein